MDETGTPDENDRTRFGLSDADFEAYVTQSLAAHPLASQYQELFQAAPICIRKWRQRYRGHPSVWKRLFDSSRVFKEFIEAVPVLDAVQQLVAQTTPSEPFTIIDLASGKGFLSMFLSELLPANKVKRLVLVDKAWPMHGMTPQAHHISWEHLYGPYNWPIPLTTSKVDLKSSNQRRNLVSKFVQDGPVLLLAIHLCGILSLRAIQLYNENLDKIHFFCLKPCCLPGMIHAKRKEVFQIGDHQFDAKLVCVRGKWNKNQWCGPPRATLKPIFHTWVHHLFLGIVDDDDKTQKTKVCIPVQHEGGYQNEFLFARTMGSLSRHREDSEPGNTGVDTKDNRHRMNFSYGEAINFSHGLTTGRRHSSGGTDYQWEFLFPLTHPGKPSRTSMCNWNGAHLCGRL